MAINIENVPQKFKVRTNHTNPPHNTIIFEEYFYNWFKDSGIITERTYLPILWTNLYISRNYGNANMGDIQEYLDNLDKTKKYFTIIQYADGILQNLNDLDIKIFGLGGGGKKTIGEKNLGYPISLMCMRNPKINLNLKKEILCSFIGVIKGRHRVREKMFSELKNEKGFLFAERIGYSKFSDTMSKSIFSLCPRGYGRTSFRICESLQHKSIPIYIYDTKENSDSPSGPWLPFKNEFNFTDIGLLIPEDKISEIPKIINNISDEQKEKYIKNGEEAYEKYFAFQGASKSIIRILND